MDTDEQVPAEETAVDESQETNSESNDSEVESQPVTENTDKGDLRVPLKQTREELRQLKEQLDDPNFIYEQAKKHGLAQEEDLTSQVPPEQDNQGQSQGYMTPEQIQKIAKDQVEIEKTYEKYPELRTDEDLRFMVSGLINKGMSPLRAADKFFAKQKELADKVAKEAEEVEKKVVKDQQSAQSITSTSDQTSDDSVMERLYKQAHDRNDPRAQKKAMIELEKLKLNKQN